MSPFQTNVSGVTIDEKLRWQSRPGEVKRCPRWSRMGLHHCKVALIMVRVVDDPHSKIQVAALGFFPPLQRGESEAFTEHPPEMTVRGESAVGGNFSHR